MTDSPRPVSAVSFDCFDTLVTVTRPDDPAAAVARALRERDVAVPDDWADAYRERHVDAPDLAEVPLPAHVAAALRSRGVEVPANAARRAVVSAFDPEVSRCPGVTDALDAAREYGPVAVCSNCSVPELVRRSLIRADLADAFDVVVTSAACGWRKPHAGPFEAVARRLSVPVAELVHAGDDPETDRGIESAGDPGSAGGRAVLLSETPLADLPERLAALDGSAPGSERP